MSYQVLNETNITKEFEKLEKKVKAHLAKYKDFEILEHADIVRYKKDRAELVKFSDKIDRVRIDYNKDVKKVGDDLKAIPDKKIKDIDKRIKKGAKTLEDNRKDEISIYVESKLKEFELIDCKLDTLVNNIFKGKLKDYQIKRWEKLVDVELETIKKELEAINKLPNSKVVKEHYYKVFDLTTALSMVEVKEDSAKESINGDTVVITFTRDNNYDKVINTLNALKIDYKVDIKDA